MSSRVLKSAMFAAAVSMLIFALPSLAAATAGTGKPNILVIFTDDHGWADLGASGVDRHIRTPNVDRLAGEGVRFPNGYVTAPQCTPSRAGLMCGQYQSRIGVEHNGIAMRSEVVTLPERLKAAGYVTGISGKWHLDVEDQRGEGGRKNVKRLELGPWGQGFDEYFSGFMQDYEASHGLDGAPYADAPKKVREEGCRVVLQTEWALQFLKRRAAGQKQPWFLYLSKKLDAWLATLNPPGPPEPLAPHRAGNFVDHELLAPTEALAAQTPREPEGSIQGWICRNGTIAVRDNALCITPAPDLAKNARPFLSKTGLDLAGPVTVTLQLRAQTRGPSTVTWRTKLAGFTPEQTATFGWPAGDRFQEVRLELPEKSRIIHIRITPARAVVGAEIQSIDLQGKVGPATTFRFPSQD